VLDPKTRKLTYSRAGHNPPRLVRGQRVLSLDQTGSLPLGLSLDEAEYNDATIALEKGDLLLLYTDGVTEASPPVRGGKERELFGVDRLDKVLLTCASGSAEGCIAKIRAELAAFTENAPQTDDQTLIAIRCV
jgi:sigma-B regulation protein RsbU (phosphoserine phosphatase)